MTVELEGLRVASVEPGTAIGEALDEDLLRWAGAASPTIGAAFHACASSGAGRFCSGNFMNEPGFYGIEFEIAGATHYGWIPCGGRSVFRYLDHLRVGL